MIYKILEKAKDMGATTNEIKKALTQDVPDANINNQKINNYVKEMEKDGHIKTIKGQQVSRSKVHMLLDFEPNS